jgi:hypothetical protein
MAITGTYYPATTEGGSECFDGTSVWTAYADANVLTLQQFNPTTGVQLNSYTIAIAGNFIGGGALTFWQGSLWYAEFANYVAQIDPSTGTLINEFQIDSVSGDTEVTAAGVCHSGNVGVIYLAFTGIDSSLNNFVRICQMTLAGAVNWITQVSTSNGCSGPVFDGTQLWFADEYGNNLYQVTEAGVLTQTVPMGTDVVSPAAFSNLVWVADRTGHNLFSVNVNTYTISGPFPIPSSRFPYSCTIDPTGNIWVLDEDFTSSIIYVDVFDQTGTNTGTFATTLTDTGAAMVYESSSQRVWTPGKDALSAPTMLALGAAGTPPAWLIINEPSIGLTDRTNYLFRGANVDHNWSLQLRQRGQASIDLWIPAGDAYTPTRATPLYLWDETPGPVWSLEFSGLIQDIQQRWIGKAGNRRVTLTAVSFESVFDTVYVSKPMQYVNQTCGFIFTDLFNTFESGCPVALGTISAGVTIPLFNAQMGDKLSDLFGQLATTSLFTWGVNPQTDLVFFQAPSAIAAPFTLADLQVNAPGGDLSIIWKINGADYRNRQAVKLSETAFGPSMEFFVGTGQQTITLMRPVGQVTNAYATLSTCNTAVGTFSGQPSPGDTVTIGPASGTWLAHHLYGPGGVVIINGYLFVVTFPSSGSAYSGLSTPPWAYVTGDTVIDGSVIWTCQGPTGLATGTDTYTFVSPAPSSVWSPGTVESSGTQINAGIIGVGSYIQQCTTPGTTGSTQPVFNTTTGGTTTDGTVTWTCEAPCLDNTVFGLVVIDPSGDAATCQNLMDAINANANQRGLTFSLPTWECNQCNAINNAGTSFTLQQKAAGAGWVSSSSATGTAFSWSAAQTSSGTSPQASLGPGEGATISLQVYEQGTSTAAPGVAYVKGSNVVTLATPLNVGSNLNIAYVRADAGVIEVEATALVTALAALTHGTGKYQQMVDASSQGLISTSAAAGLQLAQQALAAYSVTPQSFEFTTYQPGLFPGMFLPVSLSNPTGGTATLNGNWVIEEITAKFLLAKPYFGLYGHYRYTVKMVDISEIGSYLDFWKGMGGGSSGGSAGVGALVPTSGGALATTGLQTITVNGS